jgi:GDP/UDP-N,N'-diacetylbacillosamine 2-epimerase (hydrolysing)
MKKPFKIVVTTFSRSEFGLLQNLIKEIDLNKNFQLNILVSGSHLSHRHGYTINEIKDFGVKNITKVKMLLSKDTKSYLSKSVGDLTVKLTNALEKIKPDLVICMGDRYELLSLGSVITILNIPLAHISGGEVTLGAIDDQIRHSMSKLSHFHFVANKKFKNNLINMGEENWRIKITGDPGLENIHKIKKINKSQIEKNLNLKISTNLILVTFHPVTHELNNTKKYVNNLISCLKVLKYQIIITGSNADNGGEYINNELKKLSKSKANIHFYQSLGTINYLNILKYTSFVIGNSSSSIVELPSYGVFAINIGNRQKGRLQSTNIINVGYSSSSILMGINKINQIRKEFKFKNPYYKKNSSKIIIKFIINKLENLTKQKLLKKKFNERK